MSQTVITQPCYGAIHEIICHLLIYAVPDASSNATSAKRCGYAFPPDYTPAQNTTSSNKSNVWSNRQTSHCFEKHAF